MSVSITLNFNSPAEAIEALGKLNGAVVSGLSVGKPVAATEAASGQNTARAGAAPAKTAKDKAPAADSAAAQPQGSTAATGEAGNAAAGSSSQDKPAASSASSSAPAASPLAYEPVGKAITTYAAKLGRDAALRVLGTFGVKSGKELKPEQYQAALEAFSAPVEQEVA